MKHKMLYIVKAPKAGIFYTDEGFFRVIIQMDKAPKFKMNFTLN